jgi:ATP-dependent RNA helicase HelY
MAVNLIRNYDRTDAEHLVNSSFAQFQADQHVVVLERKRTQSEAYLASYHERATCERGDVFEYRELKAELEEALLIEEGRTRGAQDRYMGDAIAALRPGDVLVLPIHELARRDEVVALLDQLHACGWRAGQGLPGS